MTRPTRGDVEQLLADLADRAMDLPVDNDAVDAVRTLPIIRNGKVIGRATEPAGDYRPAMQRHQHDSIRELQRALGQATIPSARRSRNRQACRGSAERAAGAGA